MQMKRNLSKRATLNQLIREIKKKEELKSKEQQDEN